MGRERYRDTQTQGEEGHVTTEAETSGAAAVQRMPRIASNYQKLGERHRRH